MKDKAESTIAVLLEDWFVKRQEREKLRQLIVVSEGSAESLREEMDALSRALFKRFVPNPPSKDGTESVQTRSVQTRFVKFGEQLLIVTLHMNRDFAQIEVKDLEVV